MKRVWKFVSTPRFSYMDNLAIFTIAAIIGVWWR